MEIDDLHDATVSTGLIKENEKTIQDLPVYPDLLMEICRVVFSTNPADRQTALKT